MNICQYFSDADLYEAEILIVDDEAANVRLMQKILAGAGYRNISTTHDSCEVRGLCERKRFDLLVLDINMPVLDGFQLMELLERDMSLQKSSILVLTANDSREFRIRALESGARDVITKPFDRVELLARVRNLIEVQIAHRYMRDQNQILEKDVLRRTRELQNARLQAVQRLGHAAEYRDNETGLHIIRMSNISALLGKSAGLCDYEYNLLLNASPMHDIGKIGIPDRILLKQGKLNPDEWELMKTHTQIGADILAGDDSDLMIMAREIAITHHEKWDGSGYPHGLKGTEIPLAGRIVAIADVFDALTSDRPYKRAWPVQKAIDLIRDERGKHFDPALVDAFFSILPEIIAVTERYSESETDNVVAQINGNNG